MVTATERDARAHGAVNRANAVSMSLSRRFLSLPQELEGVSLPPQVAGDRHGVVTLAVPHILESAAAPRALAPVSLVRVRWWGEEKPGSLFRPALLSPSGQNGASGSGGPNVSADGSPYSVSPRTIAMRYPVHVSADRLLEYFQDMKALQMDVIDRVTRKKFGYCSLSLLVQDVAGLTGVRAEDRLATLRKENALCEIVSTDPGEEDTVLGYLAVDFDIEWVENVPGNDADPSTPASIGADGHFKAVGHVTLSPTDTSGNDASVRVETPSRSPDLGDQSLQSPPWSFEDERRVSFQNEQSGTGTLDPSEGTFTGSAQSTSLANIQHLIEKGKALQQRMEQAVRFVDPVESELPAHAGGPSEPSVVAAWRDKSQADSSPSLLFEDIDYRVPDIRGAHGGEATLVLDLPRSNDGLLAEEGKSIEDLSDEIDHPAKGHVDSMEMTFEQMELEPELIDQLRQLRDPSSATSRFSPVKITVTHTEVPSLFAANDSDSVDSLPRDSESTAFAVTTSLRKRQWRPNCSKVSSVEIYANQGNMRGWSNVRRVLDKRLTFRVVCENESDAQRRVRRRERGLFPLPTKSIELRGSVDANELFDRVLRSDAWVTQISLFLSEDEATSPLPTKGNARGKTKRRLTRHPLCHLQVKFRLFAAAQRDGGGAHRDDDSLTLIQNLDMSESGMFESGSVAASEAPSMETLQDARARATTSKVPLTPPFRGASKRTTRTTAVRSTMTSSRFEGRLPGSLGGTSRIARYREQLQFAVIIAKAVVALSSASDHTPAAEKDVAPVLTIQYSVPYHFTNRLSVVRQNENVERRAKRKLVHLQGNKRFAWAADFTGHSNVIPSRFHADAADYFDRGILILEVWRGNSDEGHGILLGVVKISLHEFGAFMRNTDLEDFCNQLMPFAVVEGAHPIDNPFTGKSIGLLRLRVCIGTAEQILVLTSTLPAIIALQAITRGVLCRMRYGIRRQRQTTQVQATRSQAAEMDLPHMASPTINATPIENDRRVGADNNMREERYNPTSLTSNGESRSLSQPARMSPSTHELANVRFDICRCWREMTREQANVLVKLPSGVEEQAFDAASVEALEMESSDTPARDISFHQAVKQIYRAAEEVQHRLLGLEVHSPDGDTENEFAQDDGADKMDLPTADFAGKVDEDGILSLDTQPPLPGQRDEHAKNSEVAIADDFDVFRIVVPESDHAQELEPALDISRDEDAGHLEESLAIETAIFMPITLASFGIEEVEFSPWSEGSAMAPGSDSQVDEPGSPRFELVMDSDDDADLMTVRQDEDENGPIAAEQVKVYASGDERAEHSDAEYPVLELSISDASDEAELEEVVAAPSRVGGDAEPDGDCIETNHNSQASVRAPPIPDQNDEARSIGADDIDEDNAEDVADAAGDVYARGLEVPQPAANKLDKHDGDDVEYSGQRDSKTALPSSPAKVNVAVQVNLGTVVPKDNLVEGGADSGTEPETSCAHPELQEETADPTHEVQPPTNSLNSTNQDAALISDAEVIADDDIGHELGIVGRNPHVAVENDASCEDDPAHPELAASSTDPPADVAASSAPSLPVQLAPGCSNDKLDLIVDLLNEILVVCMRTAQAGAVSGAQPTSQVVQDGVRSSSVVSSTRSAAMCDAQTQVEEDLNADTASHDSAPLYLEGGINQQAEVEGGGPPSKVELEHGSDSSAISVSSSYSSTSSSEEAFRAARIARAPQITKESTQSHDARGAAATEDNLRLRSFVSSPPPHPVARPPLLLRTDRSSSMAVAVDRLACELSSLYDSKSLAPVKATSTTQRSSPPSVGTSRLRFPIEKRAPLQFPHDSETERIARIMQGSITYWMKESEDGSGDSHGESDDSDSDYLF